MKKLFVVLAILFIGILLAGCTSQPPAPVVTPTPAPTPLPTPVPTPQLRTCYAIIADDPQFPILATALKASKLDAVLDGPGSFTILAPNDDAFKSLPNGTVETLLKDPQGQLKQVLLDHVIDNKTLLAVDVVKIGEAKTMQGAVVKINNTPDGVTIGGAKVTKTDIVCSNGVIHVINRVIIPPVEIKTATPTPTPTPQPSVTISFNSDLTITPGTVVYVPVGSKVIWKNNDPYYQHGLISYTFGGMESIPYGKTFEASFTKVGTFDYTTTWQPKVAGQIIVYTK
ncbi:MAG: fasciclin domain-containing protein [Methanoregula sp.]|nr:fasciclin domain-containing protein [Methanoregula sp.]